MRPIPIEAAQEISRKYGYDQVIIYARKVGASPDAGEHMTTYGRNIQHCAVAKRIGDFLKFKVMGWIDEQQQKPATDTDSTPKPPAGGAAPGQGQG